MNLLNIIDIEYKDYTSSTYFALFNKSQLKYLIDKNDKNFFKNLMSNQGSFSLKHKIFKFILKFLPISLLRFLPNVKCCSVKIKDQVEIKIKENINKKIKVINYIIGTKGPHQKIVTQLITVSGEKIYLKVGNKNVHELLLMENRVYNYLKNHKFNFNIPNLLFSVLDKELYLNALTEIVGEEAPLDFNKDIFTLYQDISEIELNSNLKFGYIEIAYDFSHGDFAPWNIKKNKEEYIIYDWEYAGMRFRGYDIIHYVTQVENLINKNTLESSIIKGILAAKKYVPYLEKFEDEYLKKLYIEEREKTYMVNLYEN
jgi:thiamine kinase-like enzyme